MATKDRASEAAYKLLARELRSAILDDRFPEGARLPTEAELAAEYNVSRQTVRRAFHDLVSEGMVQRFQGRGTFAASSDRQYVHQFGSILDLMGLSLDTQLEVVQPLRRQVNVAAASRLRLDGDAIYSIVFRRLYDDVPFCHTEVFLPPGVGEKLEGVPALVEAGGTSSLTIIGLIDPLLPNPISEAEQSITAIAADATMAAALDRAVGDPLMRVDRIYYTIDGLPVELAISHFNPEHYSYRVKLRRSIG
jgi:GntR family transcriptional regulator